MSRKSRAVKRELLPDPRYMDKLVSKFICKLMIQGKKSVAEKIVYDAFNELGQKTGQEPLKYFKEAFENVKPVMEVRSRRVGGATYQVPMEVRSERRVSLGLRWLILSSRDRGGRSMEEKLASEIIDAHEMRGGAVKKKEDVHRMAEANRAFAHYRW
ncbi:MAG: 30S ribosomal protein S7 [Deltaproteobacteria bacterium]|nr:30S ribosomal protein S7 [Deltaproteobacteria bacterium]